MIQMSWLIPGETVDPGLDEDKPKLGILVLAVPLQVLPDADGLLDQVVDVLGEVGSQTLALEDAEDLVAGDEPDLGNTMGIPEDDTDLGWGQTLLGQLVNVLLDIFGGEFQPSRNRATVGESGLGNTLSRCVHTTHGVRFAVR